MTLPALDLEAGFAVGGGYAYYDVTDYDDGTNYAPDSITHDISAYVRDSGFTIQRGTTSIVTTGFGASAGTFQTTLDNRDRRFDPNNLAGPYVQATSPVTTLVVPGVAITLTAPYNAVAYPLFTGTADEFPQLYPMVGADQTVSFQATDATRLFANTQLTLDRPAERSGARVAAIVAEVGYTGPTSIAAGDTMVTALSAGQVSAWSHLSDVVNAEWGDLYFAADGTLTFRDRDHLFSDTRSLTSQATFGDGGGTELPIADATMGSPPIVNDVTVGYGGSNATVRAENTASQLMPWGRRSLNIVLPIANQSAAQQYADWIVLRYGQPITTFASIVIKPEHTPTSLWPQALGRELGDRITVKRTPQGGGSRIVADCWIRGIRHDYQNRSWTTTFYLQDASWTLTLALYDVTNYDDPTAVYAI